MAKLQKYVDVVISTALDSGELLGQLQDRQILGAWEAEGVLHIYWAEGHWNPLVLDELIRVLTRLGDPDAAERMYVESLPDRDWNASWSKSLEPIRIGRRFRIRQSWSSPDISPDVFELIIDPKRAFGTGYHSTTQLILEWLEEHIHGGERVLDVGTGTGILSMAGLRLGAASALGIDDDPVAIECACENAAINGFGPEFELRTASLDDLCSETFDRIVANLDRGTLLRMPGRLMAHLSPGGSICLSGLQSEDFSEVAAAYGAAGGRVVNRWARDEWIALEVRF